MTTQLKCEHCNKIFEISNAIANAMTRWRDASGEPITCGECAGDPLEEIDTYSSYQLPVTSYQKEDVSESKAS